MQKTPDEVLRAAVLAYAETGSQRAGAKVVGVGQSTFCKYLAQAKERGILVEPTGSVTALAATIKELPDEGYVARYILTCAQNYTKLHEPTWKNLLALAEHYNAEIMVSTFKYNKDAMGQRASAKWETKDEELAAEYPREIIPYVSDERVDLAPNLTWCGELNILPTAEAPLSSLENYTFRRSTIVPHPKLALESVPTMRGEGVKLLYTTGCITQRNYIKRKVGYKAEHFHSYGALLVEVDSKGRWYCRQLQLGNDEAIHDLDVRVHKGKVTTGHRVDNICWGDVHPDDEDVEVTDISWGKRKDSMIEVLRPKSQHAHDLLGFSRRSHHTRKDPYAVFKAFIDGKWEMTQELRHTADTLWNKIARPWCETYVVNSNHDRHLLTFLKEVDWRDDPTNARMILALNLAVLESIANRTPLNMTEHALRLGLPGNEGRSEFIKFLAEDESHVIQQDIDGGIECGLHGDRGANGAKGTIRGIAKTDRKINIADKHQVAIVNHLFCCGTSGKLALDWNHGLSSWTHAHTVTYPNGTRTIISIWKGKWRA